MDSALLLIDFINDIVAVNGKLAGRGYTDPPDLRLGLARSAGLLGALGGLPARHRADTRSSRLVGVEMRP